MRIHEELNQRHAAEVKEGQKLVLNMASIFWVPVMFALGTLSLYYVSCSLPNIDTVKKGAEIGFPSSLSELADLADTLLKYKEQHYFHVFLLFVTAYIYKQTFAIPGSVFMNLLAGALFNLWMGFPLACFLTAIGATNCYLLSQACGKSMLEKYFPGKVRLAQKRIAENGDGLFFFLLFLRIFPFAPNWFMNMVAPILGIPIHIFFASVFLGLMPYNFLCVQMGCLLSQVKSMDDIFNMWTFCKLVGMALVALIPGIWIRKHQQNLPKQRTD